MAEPEPESTAEESRGEWKARWVVSGDIPYNRSSTWSSSAQLPAVPPGANQAQALPDQSRAPAAYFEARWAELDARRAPPAPSAPPLSPQKQSEGRPRRQTQQQPPTEVVRTQAGRWSIPLLRPAFGFQNPEPAAPLLPGQRRPTTLTGRSWTRLARGLIVQEALRKATHRRWRRVVRNLHRVGQLRRLQLALEEYTEPFYIRAPEEEEPKPRRRCSCNCSGCSRRNATKLCRLLRLSLRITLYLLRLLQRHRGLAGILATAAATYWTGSLPGPERMPELLHLGEQ